MLRRSEHPLFLNCLPSSLMILNKTLCAVPAVRHKTCAWLPFSTFTRKLDSMQDRVLHPVQLTWAWIVLQASQVLLWLQLPLCSSPLTT